MKQLERKSHFAQVATTTIKIVLFLASIVLYFGMPLIGMKNRPKSLTTDHSHLSIPGKVLRTGR